MFILGTISLFQIAFLPGFLFLSFIKFSEGFIRTIVLSFAFSLIINYFLVLFLVLFNLYIQPILLSIVLIEICLILYWKRNYLTQHVSDFFAGRLKSIKQLIMPDFESKPPIRMIDICIIFTAIGIILFFSTKAVIPWDTQSADWQQVVLSSWDAIISWNGWALSFFNNSIPTGTYHYPQLMPANWSLTYVIMGNGTVQFFIRALAPLFPLATLLMLFDLGLHTNKIGYLIGVTITGCMFLIFQPVYISASLADIPVAFMSFVPIYLLLLSMDIQAKSKKRTYFLLGAIACSGAALTKQAGLYVLLLYPLFASSAFLRSVPGIEMKHIWKLVAIILLVLLLLTVPSYVYQEFQIMFNNASSEIQWVTEGIHEERNLMERLSYGVKRINGNVLNFIFTENPSSSRALAVMITFYTILFLGLLYSIPLWEGRFVLFGIATPFFFIWAFFYSYDLRNCVLAVPFAGVAMGLGLQNFREVHRSNLDNLFNFRLIIGLGLLTTLVLITSLTSDDGFLMKRQSMYQRLIGNKQVNFFLYRYKRENGIHGKILTHYEIINHLPGLEEHYRWGNLYDLEAFKKQIADKSAGYILYRRVKYQSSSRFASTKQFIEQQIRAERFVELSSPEGIVFIKIKRADP